MAETLKDICKSNGCIWAIESTGKVKGTPPKGKMYCFWLLDPEKTKSDIGCTAAAIRGQYDHMQGGDIRFGVMKMSGFTQNTDYANAPPNHPSNR
jgi:hypothetical protein